MLNRNHKNTESTYHFGLNLLFDDYMITSKFLCDGYLIDEDQKRSDQLIINALLCDDYVIGNQILFDEHLKKDKL